MSTGAICGATLVSVGLQTLYCPTCLGDRGFLLEHYEWYGWNETCLSCGDVWSEGEMLGRPFERAWRIKSIEAALRRIEAALATKEKPE